jgi:uncharacterized protein YbjT (DUF2867 family)
MKYRRILVIGGSGFIGSELVARLAAHGHQVLVPSRRRERVRHLLVLPTVEVVQVDIYQPALLKGLVARVDAVVNLVGVLHDKPGVPYGPKFATAHVELPRRIADACISTGAKRMLHMSALGVREGREHSMPSMYLRSKAAGEQALRSRTGLELTVFRPSVVFGQRDSFLNLFAKLALFAPFIPLARADTKLQPVFVQDVVLAMFNALHLPAAIGKTYELAGPEVYPLRDLVALAASYSGHPRAVFGLPDFLGKLQATLLEFMPGPTLMSRDNFASLKVDNVLVNSQAAGFAALGITPSSLSAVAPGYLSNKPDLHSQSRAKASR